MQIYSNRIFNVANYGAKGDANDVTDAGMTGTTTLTSASANFTSRDVGKSCIMYGSGSAGINQVGTITGFTNATTITVSLGASGTVTGKEFFYGTEAATGIQAASRQMLLKSGTVWMPIGDDFLGANWLASAGGVNPNAQVYTPRHTFFSGQFEYQISIVGEETVNIHSGYFLCQILCRLRALFLPFVISGSGTNPAVNGGVCGKIFWLYSYERGKFR